MTPHPLLCPTGARRQEIAQAEAMVAFLEEHILTSLRRLHRERERLARLREDEAEMREVEQLAGGPVVLKGE